jgi:hypothetical protein
MKRQVTLRLGLSAIAVLAIGLARWTNRARRQQAVIAAVLRSGGGVAYDYQFFNGDPRVPNPNGRPPVAGWLRTMLGDDYFSSVAVVGFTGRQPHDEELSGLRSFSDLRSLYVACPGFGDPQAAHLRGLTRLEDLYLGSAEISDASIPVLKRLGTLKELNIGGTKISAAGAKELQRSLPDTRITHY